MFKKNKIDFSILGFVLMFFLISVININSALTYLPKDVGNLSLKQMIAGFKGESAKISLNWALNVHKA